MMGRVLAVALLLVLGLVGYRYLQDGRIEAPASIEQAARQAGEAARTAIGAVEGGAERLREEAADAQARVVNGIDVGRELRDASERMRTALADARQNADPGAALPTLEGVNRSLQGLDERVAGWSAEARRALAGAVAAALPTVRGLAVDLKANPDANRVLGPTLDGIIARLEGWARAPA